MTFKKEFNIIILEVYQKEELLKIKNITGGFYVL